MLFEASLSSSVCMVPMIVLSTTETVPPAPVSIERGVGDAAIAVRVHDAVADQDGGVGRRANRTDDTMIDLDLERRLILLNQERRLTRRSRRAIDA